MGFIVYNNEDTKLDELEDDALVDIHHLPMGVIPADGLVLIEGEIAPPLCSQCGAYLTQAKLTYTAIAWSDKQVIWDPAEGFYVVGSNTEITDYDSGCAPLSSDHDYFRCYLTCDHCLEESAKMPAVSLSTIPASDLIFPGRESQAAIADEPGDQTDVMVREIGLLNLPNLLRSYDAYLADCAKNGRASYSLLSIVDFAYSDEYKENLSPPQD